MRIVNFILAVVFMIFAFLQVNDPNPVIWILVFGFMAVTCVLAMFRIYIRVGIIALILTFGFYSLLFLGDVREWISQGDPEVLLDNLTNTAYPYAEESRKFLSLIICEALLFFYLFQSRRPA